MAVELYPHQEKAVQKLQNGNILWGDVGTGKTITAAAYYMRREMPKDVYVITTAKKRDSLDWDRDFARFGIGKQSDATIGGVLTIDSWNNLSKYSDVEGAFFIFDEQRLVGSGAWTKAFIRLAKSNNWILLTATPGDTWLDYIPVFVANGFYRNRSAFLQEHVIYNRFSKFPKVDRYLGVNTLVRHKNSVLVHMPYVRHTTRVVCKVNVAFDPSLFERVLKKRWHVYESRPLRDVAELFLVMRKVVNSSPDRMAKLLTLTEKHPRLIVFYNFDYELENLRNLFVNGSLTNAIAKDEAWPTRPTTSSSSPRRSSSSSSATPSPMDSGKTLSIGTTEPIPRHADTMSSRASSDQNQDLESSLLASAAKPSSTLSGSQTRSTTTTTTTTSGFETERPSRSRQLNTSASEKQTLPSSSEKLTIQIDESKSEFETASRPSPEISVAEWNGHKHEAIPSSDRWVYLVQYQAGAEGWNCTDTDAMVFYSLTYSYKLWHQAHGRIDRLNTTFSKLYYYVFMSDSVIDKAIWTSLLGKKSFNERQFVSRLTTHSGEK